MLVRWKKIFLCSDIPTLQKHSLWTERRIFWILKLCYVEEMMGFKELSQATRCYLDKWTAFLKPNVVTLDLLQQEYGLRTEKRLRPTDWIKKSMSQEKGGKYDRMSFITSSVRQILITSQKRGPSWEAKSWLASEKISCTLSIYALICFFPSSFLSKISYACLLYASLISSYW